MNILLILLVSLSNSFHIGHMAEYKYQLHENKLTLEFRIEHFELMNFDFAINCDFKNSLEQCTSNYLSENALLQIDGKNIEFNFTQTYQINDYRIVLFEADLANEAINEIKIENICFNLFDQDFKNRVIIDIGQFQKSYLLDSKRSTIHLN